MPTKEARKRRGRPPKSEPSRSDLILQTALAVFAAHGFEGANLRQIASTAGIDVALIAHRFGSKLELWKTVVDDLAERFLQELFVSVEQDALSDVDVLQHAMDRMIDLVCDTPQLAMFVVKEVAQQDERFEYVYERLIKPIHDLLLPHIQAARTSGALKDADPDFFFFTFAGSIAMTVAMRPFVTRFSTAAEAEQSFRMELKRSLSLRGSPP